MGIFVGDDYIEFTPDTNEAIAPKDATDLVATAKVGLSRFSDIDATDY